MSEAYAVYQNALLHVCLIALAILAVVAFVRFCEPVWDAMRKFASLSRIQQIVVAAIVIGFIQYGATKHSFFTYDGGIKAGSNPSYVTNDTIHVEWQRDTSKGYLVPESAAVYIDYRVAVETNAEWGLLAQTTVGAWSWEGTLENATNYAFNVWAYYIPPEPVHTNGTWTYRTLRDRNEKYAIPLRSRVEINGKAIATPKEKEMDK